MCWSASTWCCFFFQAEDGIRDKLVTGVQTCALPISTLVLSVASESNINNTLHFEQPKELLQSQSCGRTNLFRSVRRGINPNLCAIASSCKIGRASCRERVWIAVDAGFLVKTVVESRA